MIDLKLDNFPLPAKTEQLYGEYIRIYDAIKKLGDFLVAPTVLKDVTELSLSNSAKTARMYFISTEELNYGDWVTVNNTGQLVKIASALLHYNGGVFTGIAGVNPPKPDSIPQQQTPMFVTVKETVLAGEAAEVVVSGIIKVQQLLVPGTLYTLVGQTLVPRAFALYTTAYSGQDMFVVQHLVGVALSTTHLLFRKFT